MTDRELMQQALDALDAYSWEQVQVAADALRDRLAQPEQEPVAWMHTSITDNIISHPPADLKRHPERWTALYPAPSPCPTCESLARTVMMDQTGYDPRPWIGLTDEEINEIPDCEYMDFYKAINAKLKEKNGG
jgi:hypothetical protein